MEVEGVGAEELGVVAAAVAPAVEEGFGGGIPESAADEGEVFASGGEAGIVAEDDAGAGHGGEHEPVP